MRDVREHNVTSVWRCVCGVGGVRVCVCLPACQPACLPACLPAECVDGLLLKLCFYNTMLVNILKLFLSNICISIFFCHKSMGEVDILMSCSSYEGPSASGGIVTS